MQTAVLNLGASASAMDIAVFLGRHGQFVKDRADTPQAGMLAMRHAIIIGLLLSAVWQ